MLLVFTEKKKTKDNISCNEHHFHFFLLKKNAKAITYEKQAHKVKDFVTCKYPTYPEGEQDHNRTVQGCEE